MRNSKLAVVGLIALVAGLVMAQPYDPVPDFLSGAPADEAWLEPPPMPPGPGPFSLDLAEAPPPEDAPEPPEMEQAMPARGRGRRMPELTLEQRRKMAEVRIKFLKQSGPLMVDLRVKEAELSGLWLDDEPNENKIIAKAREIDKVKEQLEELRLRNRIATMKILPPEQRIRMMMRGGGRLGRGMRAGRGLR
jgi:Spy/CpxP family protein refolding chaperone